jgi:transposase
VKVMHERVAGIDVHKKMIKVAVRSPGAKPWTRKTDILTFSTYYGVLRQMARDLRSRGVTHVVMEASGIYTDPVYYALAEEDFTEVLVVNPAHVKAVKGHKTDARRQRAAGRAARMRPAAGVLHPAAGAEGGAGPDPAANQEGPGPHLHVQRLGKTLDSAGTKLGSVASDITGKGPAAMIEALIDDERRGAVMADLAIGRARAKMADLSMALEAGSPTTTR